MPNPELRAVNALLTDCSSLIMELNDDLSSLKDENARYGVEHLEAVIRESEAVRQSVADLKLELICWSLLEKSGRPNAKIGAELVVDSFMHKQRLSHCRDKSLRLMQG